MTEEFMWMVCMLFSYSEIVYLSCSHTFGISHSTMLAHSLQKSDMFDLNEPTDNSWEVFFIWNRFFFSFHLSVPEFFEGQMQMVAYHSSNYHQYFCFRHSKTHSRFMSVLPHFFLLFNLVFCSWEKWKKYWCYRCVCLRLVVGRMSWSLLFVFIAIERNMRKIFFVCPKSWTIALILSHWIA